MGPILVELRRLQLLMSSRVERGICSCAGVRRTCRSLAPLGMTRWSASLRRDGAGRQQQPPRPRAGEGGGEERSDETGGEGRWGGSPYAITASCGMSLSRWGRMVSQSVRTFSHSWITSPCASNRARIWVGS